jgi:hypothetical protein
MTAVAAAPSPGAPTRSPVLGVGLGVATAAAVALIGWRWLMEPGIDAPPPAAAGDRPSAREAARPEVPPPVPAATTTATTASLAAVSAAPAVRPVVSAEAPAAPGWTGPAAPRPRPPGPAPAPSAPRRGVLDHRE